MPENLTFFAKDTIECPICGYNFRREELMSGGGRLNAGKLTEELRRLYIPTQKWGKVNPLIYPITVCPNCLYAAFKEDFINKYITPEDISRIESYRKVRGEYAIAIVGSINFEQPRDLKHGLLSYILAISSYSFQHKKLAPSFKKAVSSLRAAWLAGDLFDEEKKPEYARMQLILYKKALEFYTTFIEKQSKGEETIDGIKFFGPDTDKDFGFEGVLYIYAVLKYKLLFTEEDIQKKLQAIAECKRYIAKFVGIGKKSPNKPADVLELGRDLYEKMSKDEEELQKQLELTS
ncbi:MAG: DUF2225 domain-containing protein [Brevinematales bacterium]|nr:DUF2225 domain-containing protein [Brevinematales bacterium]